MPDELAAQGRAEHEPVVADEVGDARTRPGLDHSEGRTRAFDLAGGGGEQVAGGGEIHAEDGGDLVGGEMVAHGQFERLPLLRGGAGGLRPGQQGQFAAAPLLDLLGEGRGGRPIGALCAARRVAARTFLLGLGQPPQARPAGQRVQPGPAVRGCLGDVPAAPFGEREGVAQGGGRGVVVAQHGQAVGEQTVQVGLVARGRPLHQRARRTAVTRFPVRPVGAGRAGRDLRRTARHSATVGCRECYLPAA